VNECELSMKVLVLVINVALAYTDVPLLRIRRVHTDVPLLRRRRVLGRRRRRRRKRRRRARSSFASLSFRALPAQWAWWWFPLLRSFLIAHYAYHAASRALVIKLSFRCF
jgi:hypothetical protein